MRPKLALAGLVLCFAGPGSAPGQALFNFTNFHALTGLALQGQAVQATDQVRLTPASPTQAGALWYARRVFLGGGFETVFQFQITGRGGAEGQPGGEGLVFVIQNNAVPALGAPGDGLGYDGVPKCLAVEFDVRPSGTRGEPGASHVSVHTRGASANSADHSAALGTADAPAELGDSNPHTARIACVGGTLQVFLDDLSNPRLTVALPAGEEGQEGSLAETLSLDHGLAWVGFTATTGESFENHDLLNWSFARGPSPLTVSLLAPLDGASYLCPARMILEASATSSTGHVARVEFYQGTTKLGDATSSPWQFLWKDVAPGAYSLTAVARDESGAESVSPPAEVTVRPASPSIGIHFSTGDNGASYPLGLTEQAGVVEQRVWNSLGSAPDGSGAGYNLRNGAGAVTTVDVLWDAVGPSEDPSINPALSGDHKLMKAGLTDDGGAGGGQTNSLIAVQQIPFPIYDVLVYSAGASGPADRVAEFQIRNESIFLREAPWSSYSGGFVEAEGSSDQGPGTPAGNYVRFSSLTNSSFTLTVRARSSTNGSPRAAVNAIQIVPSLNPAPPQVTRGPYLQMRTATSIVVRWRTNRATDSRVRYGLSPAALTTTNEDAVLTTEHIVTLTNLSPYTRYTYAVGSTETNLAGGLDCYFVTAPTNPVPTRIWFISDYGLRNADERAVRDSYSNYLYETESSPADVWITGGDNDQTDGRDANYQESVFGTTFGYAGMLRHQPVWPTIGNHDYQTSLGQFYYANFSLPTQGEAGGVPSGSEHYYSFNYGDIHFVSLDSVDGSLSASADTPMLRWLRDDLAAVTQRWIIAYWHGAPYTKGSHDSDDDSDTLAWMTQMRKNALPVLESYGVDLVLNGHSHVYERTWLINGHYGYSDSFNETNKIDGGDGRMDGTGAYLKPEGAGTVYITAAVGGQPRNTIEAQHPAHLLKITGVLGSLFIDVMGNRLDCSYVSATGVTKDYFTISKQPLTRPPAAPTGLTGAAAGSDRVQLTWNNTPRDEMRFILERSSDGATFTPIATVGANLTNYTDSSLPVAATLYYRVRAWNAAGDSGYSDIVAVGTATPLRIASVQVSDNTVRLTWRSSSGQTYNIQRTDRLDPPDWQTVGSGIPGTGATISWEILNGSGGPMGFYRIQVPSN